MKKRLFKKSISWLLVGIMVLSMSDQIVFAENAVVENEEIVTLHDDNEVAVIPTQITSDKLFWPNENGQYAYTYKSAVAGNNYMLTIISGVYTSLTELDSESAVKKMIYMDQITADGSSVTFNTIIPAVKSNATVILSGEEITPIIVGYISKSMYSFKQYTQDSEGMVPLTELITVDKGTSKEDAIALLPGSGFAVFVSNELGQIVEPVTFEWKGIDKLNTNIGAKSYIFNADITFTNESARGLNSITKPYDIEICIQDELCVPTKMTAKKSKVKYKVGEQVTIDDVTASLIYSDDTVKQITEFTTNADSIDTSVVGEKQLIISDDNLSTEIKLYVLDESIKDNTCTVNFNTNGGNEISGVVVQKGMKISRPDTPYKRGYVFTGWYTSDRLSDKYDFSMPVNSDTVLYAGWESERGIRLVSINATINDPNFYIDDVINAEKIVVTALYSDDTKAVVTEFDTDCQNIDMTTTGSKVINISYNEFGIERKTQIKIYVHENEKMAENQTYVTISFESGCEDTVIPNQILNPGSLVSVPDVDIERENYVFSGWFCDGKAWDFAKDKATKDIILRAKWLTEYKDETSDIRCFSDELGEFEYTGTAIKPQISVIDSGLNLLKLGSDYTVSYYNNITVTKAENTTKAVVKSKGNYTGSIDIPFTIIPKDIGEENDTSISYKYSDTIVASTKGTKLPLPTIKYFKKTLSNKNGKDFSVSYMKMDSEYSDSGESYTGTVKSAGIYRIIVIGNGNYTGRKYLDIKAVPSTSVNASKFGIQVAKSLSKIPYSGDEISVKNTVYSGITVKYGKNVLVQGIDYDIEFPNDAASVGKKTAMIVSLDTNKFYGTKKFNYTISGQAMSSASVELKSSKIAYNDYLRENNIDSVKVKITNKNRDAINAYYGTNYSANQYHVLNEGTDYSAKYTNNFKPGKATLTITGKGLFTGSIKKTYTIDALSIKSSDISITLDEKTIPYCKSGAKPGVTVISVTDAGVYQLVEGQDYKLAYASNKNVTNKAVVKVTGIGNYKDTVAVHYAIEKKSLSIPDIRINVTNPLFIKKAKGTAVYKPTIMVYDNGTVLKEKQDYTLDISKGVTQQKYLDNPEEVGYIVIKASSKGGYVGERRIAYKVVENDISAKNFSFAIKNQIYSGKAINIDTDTETGRSQFLKATCSLEDGSTIELVPGEDFEIIGYSKNKDAGKATVTLKGIGNYTGTRKVTFIIDKKAIR